jgi:hypothetical protein
MHVMVAVSSLAPEPARATAQQRAEQAMAGRDFVRTFTGVYVVALKEEGERAQLNTIISEAISSGDTLAVLLISPPMPATSGPYMGRLTPTLWPEVNKKIA